MAASLHHASNSAVVPRAILAIIALYVVFLLLGWPQAGTRQIVHAGEDHAADAAHGPEEAEGGAAEDSHQAAAPPFWSVAPFVLLLLAIAVFPLTPGIDRWWESNANRFKVSMGLAVVTLAFYIFARRTFLEGHWPAHHIVEPVGGQFGEWQFGKAILQNAIMQEFIPFIVLLFSLYTICGGIRIQGDLEARSSTNTAFMLVGGLLASFIGTTGAAMLLIRPLLETNKERRYVVHTVVFFIFIVCNCGGCLLPIGDPPLFLGYLQGVPFMWTLRLWPEWLFVNGSLLAIYFLLDHFHYHRRETPADISRDMTQIRRLEIKGWKLNVPLLLGVVLAVALLDPSKEFPGSESILGVAWHPWMYLREVVQLSLIGLSLWLGSKQIREANHFNYHAIVEVAALFSGIFICMQPALQILGVYGNKLGIDTAYRFFWITGGLSSLLDNAPTYLVFFKTAQSLTPAPGATIVAGVEEPMLVAISLGAVFMGAMTYIGNGPNFMVRAIAETSGVKMPSFFGYMVYSCVVLLPLLAITAWYSCM